jgi:hypothetical protein
MQSELTTIVSFKFLINPSRIFFEKIQVLPNEVILP